MMKAINILTKMCMVYMNVKLFLIVFNCTQNYFLNIECKINLSKKCVSFVFHAKIRSLLENDE